MQAAGDHEMDDNVRIAFERQRKALRDPAHTLYPATGERVSSGRSGAQNEGTGNAHAFEHLAAQAAHEMVHIEVEIRALRHRRASSGGGRFVASEHGLPAPGAEAAGEHDRLHGVVTDQGAEDPLHR